MHSCAFLATMWSCLSAIDLPHCISSRFLCETVKAVVSTLCNLFLQGDFCGSFHLYSSLWPAGNSNSLEPNFQSSDSQIEVEKISL